MVKLTLPRLFRSREWNGRIFSLLFSTSEEIGDINIGGNEKRNNYRDIRKENIFRKIV